MSESTVAIVGAGIAATAIARTLTALGHDVVIFEQGPDIPYPPARQFEESNYGIDDPGPQLAADLRHVTATGNYHRDLDTERPLVVGGAATRWGGITVRMNPTDFRTKSLFGFDADWPIGYDDLEPWYCEAEAMIGVSGTDADNPFAPPRSRPHPLPPFEFSADDRLLAERMEKKGIHLHTTPQARTREAYDGRPACMNFGQCHICPVAVRYSPNHHLLRLAKTGKCEIRSDVSVRRVLVDAAGRAHALLIRPHGASTDSEHAARVIVVAAGGIDSPRLLFNSRDQRHPDGIGNHSGHLGRHLTFHHVWSGHLHYRDLLFPGRAGFWTGQTQQFVNPPGRGKVGGIKIEFSSRPSLTHAKDAALASSMEEALAKFEPTRRCRHFSMHAESASSDRKYVGVSTERDRFGDPCAHVHYESSDFDYRTHRYARELMDRLASASGAIETSFSDPLDYSTLNHYMGTLRMSALPADGVVDTRCRIHGFSNLYAVGIGNFASGGGAANPCLAGTALALRAAQFIAGDLKS